jgi:hypothetical protein
MTEEDAKTKWCPLLVKFNNIPVGGAYIKMPVLQTTCIASGCMMWRWFPEKTEGYCGLANRP